MGSFRKKDFSFTQVAHDIYTYNNNNSISYNNNFFKNTSLKADYGHNCKTIAKKKYFIEQFWNEKNNVLEF